MIRFNVGIFKIVVTYFKYVEKKFNDPRNQVIHVSLKLIIYSWINKRKHK